MLVITSASYSQDTQEAMDSEDIESLYSASFDIEGTVDGEAFTATVDLEMDGRDAFVEFNEDFEGEDESDTIIGIACGAESPDGFGPAAKTLFELNQKVRSFYFGGDEEN